MWAFWKNLGFTCHQITHFLYNVFLWYMSKMARHFILYFCWFDIVALWKFRSTDAYRKGHHLWSLWRLNLFWLSLLISLNINLISSTQLSYVSSDKKEDCLQHFFFQQVKRLGWDFSKKFSRLGILENMFYFQFISKTFERKKIVWGVKTLSTQ